MRTALTLILLLLTTLVVLGTAPVARACPACKDTVAGGDASGALTEATDPGGNPAGGGGLPGGFNTSVYVMLTAFFATLGMVGYTLYRGTRSPGPGSTHPPAPGQPPE